MNLQDLMKANDRDTVVARLLELYPDQQGLEKGFRDQYDKCLALTPVPGEMRLVVKTYPPCKPFLDEGDTIDVSGTLGGTRRQDWIKENGDKPLNWDPTHPSWDEPEKYGLSFSPWCEWVGMEIEPQSLLDFTEVDVIAHSLWEMSWHGFDEEKIQGRLGELKESMDEVKEGKASFVTADDFFAGLKTRIILEDGISDAVIED